MNEALAGNLCRCGVYARVRKAVHRAAELMAQPGTDADFPVPPTTGDWKLPDPCQPRYRPARPWDMTEPAERDWFGVLGDGLVVVLPPETPARGHVVDERRAPGCMSGSDGIVTAFTGKVDVGQDNRTALRLLVAEELRVPFENVRLAMGDTDLCPYDMGTFGSRSMPDAGSALSRVAAVRPRPCCRWPAGARRIEIVTGEPAVTRASQWQIAGSPHVPAGTVDAVTGSLALRLRPEHARPVARRRAATARVQVRRFAHLDTSALDGRPDVVVVRTPVGGRSRRRTTGCEPGRHWPVAGDVGDPGRAVGRRPRRVPARTSAAGGDGWSGPFHQERGRRRRRARGRGGARARPATPPRTSPPRPSRPRVAVAVWDDDGRLTIWTGTQTPFPVRAQVAAALDLDEQDVRVIVPPTGGGFGGKHAGGVATEAAVLAREIGAPVRVAWTRREEFSAGTLRPAAVIDVAAGATTDGELSAWTFTNVNSGAAAIATPYRVANQRIDYQPAESPLAQASYRALAATANNFARESHIDELAHRLGRDPVEFRLANLADERLAAVLRAAAERFGWTTDHDNSRPGHRVRTREGRAGCHCGAGRRRPGRPSPGRPPRHGVRVRRRRQPRHRRSTRSRAPR